MTEHVLCELHKRGGNESSVGWDYYQMAVCAPASIHTRFTWKHKLTLNKYCSFPTVTTKEHCHNLTSLS